MELKDGKLEMSYIKRTSPLELRTLVECLESQRVSNGNKESIVFVSDDFSREVITWKELYEKSRITAKALVRLGIRKDEVVAINVRNCPQWLYLTFGAMMAGARPVGIVFAYTDGSDLIAVMEKLKTCCLLAMDPGVENADWNIIKGLVTLGSNGQVRSSKMPYLRYLIAHEQGENTSMPGVLHFNDLIKDVPDDIELPSIHEDDIAFIFQTSGSSGKPKLVAHTHKTLLVIRQISGGTEKVKQLNDRPFLWLGGFPLHVITGETRVAISSFCKGPDDRPKFLTEVLRREDCFIFSVLPPLLHEFIDRQDELFNDWSVGCLTTGGQPLNKKFAKCVGKITSVFVYGYGGTEFLFCSNMVITNPDQFEENLSGIPTKVPGTELKIVDDNGEIVPVNTKGEIVIRGPMVFKEYYNDPEMTAAAKTPDGWYKTDDIGWLNEDGVLYVEGRKSSMIISGGMNVVPEILERVIETHPAVRSVVIVPVPDETCHQVICACVLISHGCVVTEQELRTFLDEYINDKPGMFTVLPKYYLFLDVFPELHTGKSDRKSLANMAKLKFSKEV